MLRVTALLITHGSYATEIQRLSSMPGSVEMKSATWERTVGFARSVVKLTLISAASAIVALKTGPIAIRIQTCAMTPSLGVLSV